MYEKIAFRVQYFEATEGGMDSDSFGATVYTLSEAIETLKHALSLQEGIPDPMKRNWIITAEIE